MREAVKALEVIRVLDVRRGDGTYVTSLEPHLLLRRSRSWSTCTTTIRCSRSSQCGACWSLQATGLAATLGMDEQIAELQDEVDSIDAAVTIESLVDHDIRFHREIVAMSGNAYLASLIEHLSNQTVRARVWRGLTEAALSSAPLSEHRAIADAIAQHDSALATSLATAHIAGVGAGCVRPGELTPAGAAAHPRRTMAASNSAAELSLTSWKSSRSSTSGAAVK